MRVFPRHGATASIAALALAATLSTAAAGATVGGKMARYANWLGSPWTCTLGTATYFATYSVAPGNTIHGHFYSKEGSEDAYFGYDAKRKRYWAASADSNGETESQTSADGVTFAGTLNDGHGTSKASNAYTISSARKWVVRARGSADGHAYDVLATCVRK